MTVEWVENLARARTIRQQLHRHPELAWAENDTATVVRGELDTLGIAWRPCADTGTVATIAAQAAGTHVALRADLDAMPIEETTALAYRSQVPGVMHACGHDGHTATLLAVAAWLQARRNELPGPVTLLFQPAEEGGHGARRMIDEGCLDGVEAVYGWHNWPELAAGQAICPDGSVMSANGTFEIVVQGRGGHASQPEATRDPVLAVAAITVALQQIVARRTHPHDAVVVAVTSLLARSAATVTPDSASLAGSIRAADDAVRDRVFAQISEIATATAVAYGVEAQVNTFTRYGATVNDPTAAQHVRERLSALLGPDWSNHHATAPVLASEDFSYYLQQLPGAFVLLGTGTTAPLHSGEYDFDDAAIDPAARLLIDLAQAPPPPG